jgi:hypothetical protein
MRIILTVLLNIIVVQMMFSQLRPWPDAVVMYRQGPNATPGFDSTNIHFPLNVLGPPDSTATGVSPSSRPEEIQALGTGGEIILRYNDRVIVNRPGPDFTVFENAFFVGGDSNTVFREVALVAVSKDGVTYVQFPFAGPPTWHNLAGATPTLGGNPLDPALSGGDSFDLQEIGMDSVSYIRIVDAAALVPDDGVSFDLDAVGALHLVAHITQVSHTSDLPYTLTLEQNYPNPFNPSTVIAYELPLRGHVRLDVFDLLGNRVKTLVDGIQSSGRHVVTLDAEGLPSGVLFYRLLQDHRSQTGRMVLVR